MDFENAARLPHGVYAKATCEKSSLPLTLEKKFELLVTSRDFFTVSILERWDALQINVQIVFLHVQGRSTSILSSDL
jgi:hypothetical protein